MKRTLITLFSALLVFMMLMPTTTIGQKCIPPDYRGALLFTFNGLSNMNVSPLNGGIGGKLYLTRTLALVGSIGGYYENPNKETRVHNGGFNLTFGPEVDIFTTSTTLISLGAEGYWNHKSPLPMVDNYGVAGVIGGEFFFMKNVSLGAKYRLLLNYEPSTKYYGFRLSEDIINFVLGIYF